MQSPPPSPAQPPALEYESIDHTDRTSTAARTSFVLWLLLLLAHTAAAYATAHFSRSKPPASLPAASLWFGSMGAGCLILLATWATVGTSHRHRGWDGFIWLLIAPTSAVGFVFDAVLCIFIRP